VNKVIFLDIDGPVIPIDVPVHASVFRTTYNRESIEYLNLLCDLTGAQVVTNSMHNYEDWYDGDLRDDLVKWGLEEKFIHDTWRTIFPMIDYKKVNSPVRGIGRLVAIENWINRHGDSSWVCFDDRKFADVANLIHIEDGLGIKAHHFNSAIDILAEN
jgi:hypothetical protein